MEITWNELLKYEEVKRIEAFKEIYDDSREFKKYQSMLKQASLERASENLKTDINVINETLELENAHFYFSTQSLLSRNSKLF
ncbi:MAG: hypothetical protein IPG12_10950 [Saprospiraceae bacterium]|nr:hypothetical protein [Saprospiraceae bacterium]